MPNRKDPPPIALLAQHVLGQHPMWFFMGTFFIWLGGVYAKQEPGAIENLVFKEITTLGWDSPFVVSAVVESLKQQAFLASDKLPPFAICGTATNAVVFDNGTLDLDRLLAGDQAAFGPHDLSLFATVKLAFSYDPVARCPMWEEFIDWMVGGDAETVAMLQEYIGWGFINLRLERALYLVGMGKNGKSVFLSTIHRLVGEGGAASIPLERFGERFALQSTLGKHFNLVADAEEVTKLQEGKFKAFVSEDPEFFEEKFKPGFVARPRARLIVCCNALPHFTDRSEGTWRRLFVVLCNQVPLMTNPLLADDLATELAGIFNWAMIGAARLLARKHFDVPPLVQAAITDARMGKNPTRQYIAERLIADNPDHYHIRRTFLAENYKAWMEELGYKPLSFGNVLAELQRVLGAGVQIRRLGVRGSRDWWVVGLRWRDDAEREREAAEAAIAKFDQPQPGRQINQPTLAVTSPPEEEFIEDEPF